MIARRRTVPAEIVAAFGSAVRFAVFAGERPQIVDQADAHVASQYVGGDILDIVFADVADEAFVLVQNIVNLYADLPALVFEQFFADTGVQQEELLSELIGNAPVFGVAAIRFERDPFPRDPFDPSGSHAVEILVVIGRVGDVVSGPVGKRKVELVAEIAAQRDTAGVGGCGSRAPHQVVNGRHRGVRSP